MREWTEKREGCGKGGERCVAKEMTSHQILRGMAGGQRRTHICTACREGATEEGLPVFSGTSGDWERVNIMRWRRGEQPPWKTETARWRMRVQAQYRGLAWPLLSAAGSAASIH